LAGLLSGSGSGSSRGALPNVFLEEQFFSKNGGAGAVLKEPQFVAPPKRLRLL